MDIEWMPTSTSDPLPLNAVLGGHDSDGSPIYVGRSYHEGHNLPVKVVPGKKAAYVSWKDAEHFKSHYELLLGENYSWQACSEGNIPPNAISTGQINSGEPLYIGRGHYENSLLVGRIQSPYNCLYIPFGGNEIKLLKYEILVFGGYNVESEASKKSEDTKWRPEKELPEPTLQSHKVMAVMFERPNYELIPEHSSSTSQPQPQALPQVQPTPPPPPPLINANSQVANNQTGPSSTSSLSSQVFNDSWTFHHLNHVPPNAVHAGYDIYGQLIYVGRAFHNGDFFPAKTIPQHKVAFISYQGAEIAKKHYEFLVGDHYGWVPLTETFPAGAVKVNPSTTAEALYVGRTFYSGSLLCGKIIRSQNCLYVPFGGQEIQINDNYEILVNRDIYNASQANTV